MERPGIIERSRHVLALATQLGVEHGAFVLRLAAAIFVPLSLLGTLDETVWSQDLDESGLILIPLLLSALALGATTILGSLLFAGALAAAIAETAAGGKPSIREIARTAPWPTLIAIDLLFMTGLVLGFLALVIPGVIFFGRYVLAPTLADVEHLGIRDAFRRSAEISKGNAVLIAALLGAATLAGEAIQAGLVALTNVLLGEGFFADWATSACAQIASNPLFGLISVALVLTLRRAELGRPARPE